MSAPASPIAPRVPKLGFRKALSPEEAEQHSSQMRENAVRTTNLTRKDSLSSNTRSTIGVNPPLPQKKKGSFLSGIFAKEPTITALASFEAEVKAKYGATTPQAVPHVSSQRMPEFVPKVNSRWDGVPEVVKLREKEDKRSRRISSQTMSSGAATIGLTSSINDSNITTGSHDRRSSPYTDSDAASNNGSWRSRDGKIPRFTRRPSDQSSYSGNSQSSKNQPTTQDLRSASGTSLPEITYFFPHNSQQQTTTKPQRWQSGKSGKTSSTQSSNLTDSEPGTSQQCPAPVEVIPEHSSSPVYTPGDLSPVTPGYIMDGQSRVPNFSHRIGSAAIRPPKTKSQGRSVGIDAFLAGEAKPLSLDDISDEAKCSDLPLRYYGQEHLTIAPESTAKPALVSHKRAGTRTSTIASSDVAPWEVQEELHSPTTTTRSTNRNKIPKALSLLR